MELPAPLLIIFDVDGTLTRSDDVDAEVNVRVMREGFDITDVDTDWSHYPHATDGAIFDVCFAGRWGRPPTAAERGAFEARLGDEMDQALAATPARAAALPGAAAALRALTARDGVTLAIASGAYRRSMHAKLRAGGLLPLVQHLPAATGSDAPTREEIVTLARQRAAGGAGAPFAATVSIGDGVWDVKTARALRLAFLGVGSGAARARLESAGARVVIADYADGGAFLSALRAALEQEPAH